MTQSETSISSSLMEMTTNTTHGRRNQNNTNMGNSKNELDEHSDKTKQETQHLQEERKLKRLDSKEENSDNQQQTSKEQDQLQQQGQYFNENQQQQKELVREQLKDTENPEREEMQKEQEQSDERDENHPKQQAQQHGEEHSKDNKDELKYGQENVNVDITEENKNVEDEGSKSHIKLKTLADLISVCRTRGLQIYNDITNRPEADKRLYSDADIAAFDELGPSRGKKSNQRDDKVSKGNGSQTIRTSGSRNTYEDDLASTSGYGVTRDRLNTATSFATSYSTRTGTTRLESRLSARSKDDRRYVAIDVDAEELLQQRMWKKSKRRREQRQSLLDVAKQKETGDGKDVAIIKHFQKKVDMFNIMDANSKVSFKQGGLNANSDDADKMTGGTGIDAFGRGAGNKSVYSENKYNGFCNDGEGSDVNDENANGVLDNDVSESNVKSGLKTISAIGNTIIGSEMETKGSNENEDKLSANDNDRPQGGSNKNPEIKEFRIKDGTTTLVLYKLKTDNISDPSVRQEVLREREAIDNANETLLEKQSLKNHAHGNGSVDKDCSVQVRCGDNENQVNTNKTLSPADKSKIGDELHEKGEYVVSISLDETQLQKQKKGRKEEIYPSSSERKRMSEFNDNSMDVDRRTKSMKDSHGREFVKSNDSGIGSDSEKESLNRAEQSVSGGKSKKDRSKNVTMATNKSETKSKHRTTENATMKKHEEKSPVINESGESREHSYATKGGQKKLLKPKRSLGNGFLVSSDVEDNDNANGKGAPTLPRKVNEMSKETRMVFLMEKIRQRYEDEKQSQTVYLQKISETRRELRDEYNTLREKVDMDKDYRMPEPPAEEPPQSEEDEEEFVPEREPEPKDTDRPTKKKISSRIDSKWSPNHPLYLVIKSGFKSTVKIPNTNGVQFALRSMKFTRHAHSTSNLDSLYVKEAKKLHPSLFSRDDIDYRDSKLLSESVLNSRNKKVNGTDIVRERKGKHKPDYGTAPDRLGVEIDKKKPMSKSLNDGFDRFDRNRHGVCGAEKESIATVSHTRAREYSKSVPKPNPAKMDVDDERLLKERDNLTLYERLTERAAGISQMSKQSKRHSSNHSKVHAKNEPNSTILRFRSEQLQREDSPKQKHIKNHMAGNGPVIMNGSVSAMRSTSTQTPSGEIPISQAVDIVQSRNKFYSDRFGEVHTPRDHRIVKLYRDLQHIRQNGDTEGSSAGSNDRTETSEQFIFMDYEDLSTLLHQQKSDKDLNHFLYDSQNYDMCSKGKPLYVSPDRKEKALNVLRQKVNSKMIQGTKI